MAKLITDEQEFSLQDGDQIIEPCMEMGISFGCQSGICGTCRITVIEGAENLSEKNQAEKDFPLDPGERLACQCRILKGTVRIKY